MNDASTLRDARRRCVIDNKEQRSRLDDFAVILRDGVTMDSGSMILDSIRCCEETHKQLLLIQGRNRCATPALVPTRLWIVRKLINKCAAGGCGQWSNKKGDFEVHYASKHEPRARFDDAVCGINGAAWKMVDLDRDRFY